MVPLEPLEPLYSAAAGDPLPLPAELRRLCGTLAFRPRGARPRVAANFVSTLDGVVDLGAPGKQGGGAISGFSRHDRMVMGVLRAAADAVVVGAGTLRSVPRHIWTAEYIFPDLADEYRTLRARLGKAGHPLNVFVTARGAIDFDAPVFRAGDVPVLVVTTAEGARRARDAGPPAGVSLAVAAGGELIAAGAVLDAIVRVRPCGLVLLEGGPRLMGDFFAEKCLDELFLTIAPQVAGRDGSIERPGFVAGKRFAPESPRWGTLSGVKRGGNFLFLRYAFPAEK